MNSIICPYCDTKTALNYSLDEFKIFKCKCFEYPMYSNILYFQKNTIATRTVKLIREGKKFSALKILLNIRIKLYLPVLFLVKTGIYKVLGFNRFIKILEYFSFNKLWSNYLRTRTERDYFKLSPKLLALTVKTNPIIFDIGCGVGQIFPYFYNKTKSENAIGFDSAFMSLFIAKLFYVNSSTLLVCCDIEKIFPKFSIKSDFIHVNDTLQQIKNKSRLLSNLNLLMSKKGLLSIIHIFSKNNGKVDCLGIRPKVLEKKVKQAGFKDVIFQSDERFLAALSMNVKSIFAKSQSSAEIIEDLGYTLVASKNNLTGRFRIKSPKKFVFISPHLDDAILSCYELIVMLKALGQKVEIFTIFTEYQANNNKDARIHLMQRGYRDGYDLMRQRKLDDLKITQKLKVVSRHLGFVDAVWRSDLQKNNNLKLTKLIEIKIKKYIKTSTDETVVFGPIGIGSHVDHLIVKKVVDSLNKFKKYCWEDYPYNLNISLLTDFLKSNVNYSEAYRFHNIDRKSKENAIKSYQTEWKVLFPDGDIKFASEAFWIKD